MKKHELKTWPEYMTAILEGRKTFEVRKNDRDFQEGDILVLREYDPKTKQYTGQTLEVEVTFVLPGGNFGIDRDYCVMSISFH